MAPDRIQGDAAKPRFDEAQSGIMFAQTRRRLLRHKRASLAPRAAVKPAARRLRR
jgi:hypothetical protein